MDASSPAEDTRLSGSSLLCYSDSSSLSKRCQWVTDGALCNSQVTPDKRSVVEHLQKAHGIEPGDAKAREPCHWEDCGTTLHTASLARHVLTVHLKGSSCCPDCGVRFAREDSLRRHLKRHNAPSEERVQGQPFPHYLV